MQNQNINIANNFVISQPNHMVLPFFRIVSTRRFEWMVTPWGLFEK